MIFLMISFIAELSSILFGSLKLAFLTALARHSIHVGLKHKIEVGVLGITFIILPLSFDWIENGVGEMTLDKLGRSLSLSLSLFTLIFLSYISYDMFYGILGYRTGDDKKLTKLDHDLRMFFIIAFAVIFCGFVLQRYFFLAVWQPSLEPEPSSFEGDKEEDDIDKEVFVGPKVQSEDIPA